MERVTRRGLIKALGGAAATLGLAGKVAEAKEPNAGENYTYTCYCGLGLVAKIPKNVGDATQIDCHCGLRSTLTWRGDHFDLRVSQAGQPVEF